MIDCSPAGVKEAQVCSCIAYLKEYLLLNLPDETVEIRHPSFGGEPLKRHD